MRNLWKQVRYRLEYLGVRALAGAVPRLPRRLSLALAWVLGELYYRIDGKGRAVALENLRLSFGDTLPPRRREQIARASFLNFARGMLDLFWARNLTPANFDRYMIVENYEHIREARDAHNGIIYLALHFGKPRMGESRGGASRACPRRWWRWISRTRRWTPVFNPGRVNTRATASSASTSRCYAC